MDIPIDVLFSILKINGQVNELFLTLTPSVHTGRSLTLLLGLEKKIVCFLKRFEKKLGR